ncbi:SDR family NAD(P)-dependent oxidoreductase [Arthrobacter sp. efr-133-TYG-118]|uniref:SDR family NAD(P)-dependent oxidoreductase n=1 Tax=Arthrobacter sp. efr-133-TYG-118 TaxID=3040279 RepID=UPI00254C8540|nr:SDR family NAD(P)-dependent oxidoreductase [Arthrobacter sp. efr-133-TYG-118]
MQIENTAALVTGGASGLGSACAQALAKQGARVVAVDLAAANEKAERIDGVEYLEADVTCAEDIRQAVATASSGKPLRIVINCAGILPSQRILSKRRVHDLALYAKVIEVNLVGTFNVLSAASGAIAETEPDQDGQRGVIINTASVAAFEGQIGQVAYASSKAGVVGMTLPAARDLAQYGIRVNTIAPGIVETPMMEAVSDEIRQSLADGVPFPKRLARPDEFAQLALAIIDHDYLNGETFRMDGALRMAPR